MRSADIAATVLCAVLGACFGSFVNAASLRSVAGESFLKGRSRCPACGETLRWYQLIPMLSYVALRGKCRTCAARISPRYPLTELGFALAAALCFLRFGFAWMTPLAFGVCAILLAITLIDMDTMEIPDGLIIALIPFAAAALWARPEITLLHRSIGLAAISVPMLALALMIEGAYGMGDIKLMAVCGFLLGWQSVLFAFFTAILLGGSYALYLMLKKKKKKGEHIAFGPFLCVGVAAAMLYGENVITAYLRLFGLHWLIGR
ncbi:MAG: prepilin peptidase [Oscillospiraceae bacterium]|nr:prepilin peptidase [Oscillospiraceae bacterium]